MSVRYILVPIADPLVLSPPFPVSGLSPTWEFLVRTSDGVDLTSSAPTISEHSTISGVYYFDIDYSNIGGQAAAHVTGLIDYGPIVGSSRRYQEFYGAATDYSGWLEGYPVVLQLYETGTTNPIVENAYVTLYDSTGSTPLSPALSVDSNGQVRFAAMSGTYRLVPSSSKYIAWQDLPWEITISDDGLNVTKYGTVRTPPLPSSPDKYVLYMNCTDEQGNQVGAGDRILKILNVYPPGLAADDLVIESEENPFQSDGDGQISFEIPKTVEALRISVQRTLASGETKITEYKFDIDPDAANEYDQIDIADLLY